MKMKSVIPILKIMFTLAIAATLLSCSEKSSTLRQGDDDKIKIYIGEPNSAGEYIFMFSTPKAYITGGVCQIDAASNSCDPKLNFGTAVSQDAAAQNALIRKPAGDTVVHYPGIKEKNKSVELKLEAGKTYM